MVPFLTIAVPTYNRHRWISLTLPAIIEQAKEFPEGDIEVVVSDNSSEDSTWDYLQKMAQNISFLRISRNEINIGPEANFYLLPKLATGRYLWMIGDDDLLNPGALRRVVAELRDDLDYVIMNCDVYDANFEGCTQTRVLGSGGDELFTTQEACLDRIDAMSMNFLSMWVGRHEFFNVIAEEQYLRFAQWGMSIQADRYCGVGRSSRGKLISGSYLRTRQTTEFDERNYFLWFLHGSAEVLRYAAEIGALSNAGARQRRKLLLRRAGLQRIRYQRRKGIFDRRETYRLLRADYGDLPGFWFVCVPIMFMPGVGTLLNIARRMLGRADPQ